MLNPANNPSAVATKSAQLNPASPLPRRRLLGDAALCLGSIPVFAWLALGVAKKSSALPRSVLRPPGALSEDDFINACVRCGLCVRSCPYDTLRLAELADAPASGTPLFVAREVPCEMCEDIPCVVACPTGALDKNLTDITRAKMGLAVLIDHENCLAFQGLRCEVCFNVCPVQNEAISIEKQHNSETGKHAKFIPVVHSEHCTGCGKCEFACILPNESAIKILPRQIAQASPAKHYRYGHVEKQQHGSAQGIYDHQYQLPDNLEYDDQGEGLRTKSPDDKAQKNIKSNSRTHRESSSELTPEPSPKSSPESSPFAKDPLKTLNGGLQ